MALKFRAVYEDGHLRPLDPEDLETLNEGQILEVHIQPVSKIDSIRAILGESVVYPSLDDDSDAWVELEAATIAEELGQGRSLSEIVIEDRSEP